MLNNDVLRSLRYMLDLGNPRMADIFSLGGAQIGQSEITAFLKKEDEEGYAPCSDGAMVRFLDGLVYSRRGKDESRPAHPFKPPMTNNLVLKKLRVAFELKDEDMHAIMQSVECPVSRPEMSALFRKPGHSNYRACGDQFLRNFLKGLTQRVRGQRPWR
jgi:uncharacterized protein YehS (DUF1456 family)